jgi:hypothetical protein
MKHVIFFCVLLSCSIAGADDFMRVVKPEGKRQPQALETAIVHFADEKNAVRVDLVAAVHIGDKVYYEELNKQFKRYDAVLYELVADEGTVLDKDTLKNRKEKSVLSSFQSQMGEMLGLTFQLEHVDYTAKNFVHADLSPAEFAKRASERGDLIQILYRMLTLSAKKANDKNAQNEELRTQGRIVGMMLASNPQLARKRFLARQMLEQMDDSLWIIGGEGSAIISDRNAAALKVLRQEIGKGKKNIAVFYGGAHLPEMAKVLEKDFKLKKTGTDYLTAWDLTK